MKWLNLIVYIFILIFVFSCQDKEQTTSKSGEIIFGDKKLTYFIEGEGVDCLVCADGDLQLNCISDNLKEHFQFVFIEQRHSTLYDESKDYSTITMDTIVNDIETLRLMLGFDQVYVLGHSLIGLIALEYARKYPQNTKGVIMINTPPHFNADYMDVINNYWKENATEERKEIFKTNLQNLQKVNRDSISKEKWDYLSYKAQAPKNFYNPLFDDIPYFRVNNEGWNHFYSIMREYDITRSQIVTPIFLSLSEYDFMVPLNIWNDYRSKLPTLEIYKYESSGHFPHIEEQELFDKQLLNWIKDN
jgi:proline iminopeptidase